MSMDFFFFQAEDGIRDGHVTGVQTCALPICGAGEADQVGRSRARGHHPGGVHPADRAGRAARHRRGGPRRRALLQRRSEERRVGKECRSGGWGEWYRKRQEWMRWLVWWERVG